MYAYLAEFLGVLFVVYVALATGNILAIAAAYALALILTVATSGGYLNPALTIVMAAAGKLETADILSYSLAQILGGLVALEVYKRYAMR
jgi:glycerol uptake facilitator-like aquaporin